METALLKRSRNLWDTIVASLLCLIILFSQLRQGQVLLTSNMFAVLRVVPTFHDAKARRKFGRSCLVLVMGIHDCVSCAPRVC